MTVQVGSAHLLLPLFTCIPPPLFTCILLRWREFKWAMLWANLVSVIAISLWYGGVITSHQELAFEVVIALLYGAHY